MLRYYTWFGFNITALNFIMPVEIDSALLVIYAVDFFEHDAQNIWFTENERFTEGSNSFQWCLS